VSGQPRGDGLDPTGEYNLYELFEIVPPEYREEFRPNVLVRNWQGISLEAKRGDWIGEDAVPIEQGRFIPQSVLRAMRRRAKQDPNAPIRRLLGGWRDLVVRRRFLAPPRGCARLFDPAAERQSGRRVRAQVSEANVSGRQRGVVDSRPPQVTARGTTKRLA
jgi:hypothetical protein